MRGVMKVQIPPLTCGPPTQRRATILAMRRRITRHWVGCGRLGSLAPRTLPVKSEEFIQWVVEDNFCDGRSEWEGLFESNDFMFVEDVHPFEMMKLRLLNAGHSALAYFSYLIGH